ncbi:MAG: ATP-binding cassette domain-containing protein [Anaerolineaceae bacterium]|nr:ATP-binding cassette domain-containing protein [Anaerolineaceae bacterium]
MSIVELSHVTKSFGSLKAVDDVSLSVQPGEFFGLLGPNGAGKTTSIRILLDIFKPESGSVSILGGPMTEDKKNRIGYMPEERGLYQDIPLERALTYLASLKGLSSTEIHNRLGGYLERFDLASSRKKKVKELSKGMQQKAQIISTIIHQPKLLIIDEPFSGLDPVNTQMVKDLLLDLHRQGATIIMSTHQMHQVEELCDRILLIDHGKVMLYGPLAEIRKRFSGHALLVRTPAPLPPIPGVAGIEKANGGYRLTMDPDATPQAVLKHMVAQDIQIEQFEIAAPTLDEIFIRVVTEREQPSA